MAPISSSTDEQADTFRRRVTPFLYKDVVSSSVFNNTSNIERLGFDEPGDFSLQSF